MKHDAAPALDDALQAWLRSPAPDPELEARLERALIAVGEPGMRALVDARVAAGQARPGPWRLPPIDPAAVPAPGTSLAENGEVRPIPSTLEAFGTERLRLMARILVQRFLGRPVLVNVGIGYIGTVNIAAASRARDPAGQPAYCVVGYQRPSPQSSWKVDFLQAGLPTITTADTGLAAILRKGHVQRNLTATFLGSQALAVADLIFVETELHVRKMYGRAIERAEAEPAATLQLIEEIAAAMPGAATVVIESTVYPGFTEHDALPRMNRVLRARGRLAEDENANLAYAFHRVKPGRNLLETFFGLSRDAAAVTGAARDALASYFRCAGIAHRMLDHIVTAEFTKDVENAARYGVLDVMSAFLKAAEASGVDGFAVVRDIAAARPDEHAGFVGQVAGLQVGGYCVPKELGLLINGLRRHHGLSELAVRDMFASRLVAARISDYRAEDAVILLMRAFARQGRALADCRLLWAGASYKEDVGDTRMSGTERGLRYAAHHGAANRVTDPLVVNWPELRRQRLGDPECWGHGLRNQEPLRRLRVVNGDDLAAVLEPGDDAVILAVRHPCYLSARRREAGGIDPIGLSVAVRGRAGKVLLDTFDFLDDDDIRELLALGWQVCAFGKGHVDRLEATLCVDERRACLERLRRALAERAAQAPAAGWEEAVAEVQRRVDALSTGVAAAEVAPVDAAAIVARLRDGPIALERGRLSASLRRSGQLLGALADAAEHLVDTPSADVAVSQFQDLRYLRYGALDALAQDMDRFAHEMLDRHGNERVRRAMAAMDSRPELAISDRAQQHPLFEPASAPGARLLPATVFSTNGEGRLEKWEDPEGHPYRLSTKWIPDLAVLLADRSAFPVAWSKFSMEVPLRLHRVGEGALDYELYEDFLYLPARLRDWLIEEVWGRGYVLSTLDGEAQQVVGYLMDVNLDPQTIARGRGGVLFWLDTRQPVFLTTPEGQEIALDLKAVGDYRGGDPRDLGVNYDRTIISGRGAGGGTARTNLGQVPGHMFSADDICWQERLKTMGPYHAGRTPRSVFRVRWRYPRRPAETFQMVGRASPSGLRLGQVFRGSDAHDPTPARAASLLGWNNAEILGHEVSAVHIAVNLDNVMANGYYTDLGSNIDLFTERDPEGTFRDYGGYGLLMVLYTYSQAKRHVAGGELPAPCTTWLQDWFDGFLDRFAALDGGRGVPNLHRFEGFRDIRARVTADPAAAEAVVDEWLDTLWQHYLPYRILQNRIDRGYDATVESPFTIGRDERMFDPESASAAARFLDAQRDVIARARAIEAEGYPALDFDYAAALRRVDAALRELERRRRGGGGGFGDLYQLGLFPPLEQEVQTILDRGAASRLVMARARPTIFIDKMEANVNQRMRLSGLRVTKMAQLARDNGGTVDAPAVLRAYARTWRGTATGEPWEADIQGQATPAELLALIRKDFHLASMASDPLLQALGSLTWEEASVEADGIRLRLRDGATRYTLRLGADGSVATEATTAR